MYNSAGLSFFIIFICLFLYDVFGVLVFQLFSCWVFWGFFFAGVLLVFFVGGFFLNLSGTKLVRSTVS